MYCMIIKRGKKSYNTFYPPTDNTTALDYIIHMNMEETYITLETPLHHGTNPLELNNQYNSSIVADLSLKLY